ncbi:hypothetical protein F2Q69_00034002 [Brassica cretica]|uniref:Uncharacterized protein n=1 Tax=Brassica cretica TaxID=69181 RepID=A0A8S9SIP2_BRACR|nr:hypothetical protein F2Q69_00034002 [Brassica cretica]
MEAEVYTAELRSHPARRAQKPEEEQGETDEAATREAKAATLSHSVGPSKRETDPDPLEIKPSIYHLDGASCSDPTIHILAITPGRPRTHSVTALIRRFRPQTDEEPEKKSKEDMEKSRLERG